MGYHRRGTDLAPRAAVDGRSVDDERARARSAARRQRSRYVLSMLAAVASFALVALTVAEPRMPSAAEAAAVAQKTQAYTLQSDDTPTIARDDVSVTKPPPPRVVTAGRAASAGVPDPGTAQAIAWQMLQGMGMGQDQYDCLVALWNRESHWNVYAGNPVSGAYGIPQALPGSKMASAGPDWESNPATQISWGLGYITGRYGDPCTAWAHSQASNWY